MFYLIDSYFIAIAIEYRKRIDLIERWIMLATDEDILNLDSALHNIGPSFNFRERIFLYFSALRNKYVIIFYIFFVCASFIVIQLFNFNYG